MPSRPRSGPSRATLPTPPGRLAPHPRPGPRPLPALRPPFSPRRAPRPPSPAVRAGGWVGALAVIGVRHGLPSHAPDRPAPPSARPGPAVPHTIPGSHARESRRPSPASAMPPPTRCTPPLPTTLAEHNLRRRRRPDARSARWSRPRSSRAPTSSSPSPTSSSPPRPASSRATLTRSRSSSCHPGPATTRPPSPAPSATCIRALTLRSTSSTTPTPTPSSPICPAGPAAACQSGDWSHLLAEFDDARHSCRKRLDMHNCQCRKPQPYAMSSASFITSQQGLRVKLSDNTRYKHSAVAEWVNSICHSEW